MSLEHATFAMGCFWNPEEVFKVVPGVVSTAVGYMGGHVENPTYEQVCSGRTGHAEVIQIAFDPTVVSYEKLLEVFWSNHNPTTVNRQGPDVGEQYRSAIFFHTPSQQGVATTSKTVLDQSAKWPRPVVTEVTAAGNFYKAEDYHQRYLEKHGLSSCHV